MAAQTVEIRPKVGRNVILVAILCIIFTLIGFAMLCSGEEIFGGLMAILFFGGGGAYAVPTLLRRRVPMTLTPEGIAQRYPQGTAFIPWADIEQIGLMSIYSTELVGIRLKSYNRYLGSISPDLAAHIKKNLPHLKFFARATTEHLEAPDMLEDWSKREGHAGAETLESFGKVKDFAEALLWSRNQYGFDIMFSWVELDRSPKAFAQLLEEYRTGAKAA